MAIDLTGISNENEFYSHHYLAAIFESDLKQVFETWKREEQEENKRPPYALLRGLSRDYFGMRRRLERIQSPEERLTLQREFLARMLGYLGYAQGPFFKRLDNGSVLPVMGEVVKTGGAPGLWILGVANAAGESEDPLTLKLDPRQFVMEGNGEVDPDLLSMTMDEVITRSIFGMEEPPRWVVLCTDTQVVLVDRTRWNEKRLLRFDLAEIFGRREESTFRAMAALLHRDSICPGEGVSLLDSLDEKSHKHAFAVSEDLKYSLREAIELLGNEAVYYLRERSKKKVFEGALDAGELTRECLRFMYRLLFIFYIEARPELGYAKMQSDAYRLGYSLESLRDLEMVKLTSEESKQGYFFHESIQLLFQLIYKGTDVPGQKVLTREDAVLHNTFEMLPLKTHLFDLRRTEILNGVKLRNRVLQKVIMSMSLTRPRGKKDRRGRISYAQLGINQLGAVYEALLSYQGFFAETDLYEVKKAGETFDELKNAYFVKAEDLEKYTEEERVYNTDGTLRTYEKGRFIYRLAGRDRQKSASYYTPEVLTRCLVKYALKELLKDKSADDILKLTVCEPAMGSAAFLNEALNQLAEAYLERKQRELGMRIAHDDYNRERQKVKMLLADNNVFGVDLNPVAVELAEVSLFLNTIHEGNFVPWFGMQLVNGNSLVGARRQVFDAAFLETGRKNTQLWLDEVPRRVGPGQVRPAGSIYHFLLPDRGMAAYKDKVIQKLAREKLALISRWQKRFTRAFSPTDIEQLRRFSDKIDEMWEKHIEQQRTIRARTTDPLSVWGREADEGTGTGSEMRWKDRVLEREMLSMEVRNSSPYRRLKLVMDYWCALWFWPIDKAELLPDRDEYMFQLGLILEGDVFEVSTAHGDQRPLFPDTMRKEDTAELKDRFGVVDVDKLCKQLPQLALVKELAGRHRFLHWELEFADIFSERGGFDLVLGNPPWIKVEWNEGGVMGDFEPLFVLRKFSASKLAELRGEAIKKYGMEATYFSAFEESEGTQNFLNASQNYADLKGSQSNLFKCFLPQAWKIGSEDGISGFLHPEGIYDDPKGGTLRQAVYPKLKYHFQFHNELNLFPEVDHHIKFSINIYKQTTGQDVDFDHLANLFSPQTIDACFEHPGIGALPGIKDEDGKWNIHGHRGRILHVGDNELALFAKLYDAAGTAPFQARLPALHARELVNVLKKFASQPRKLGDLKDEYFSTEMWHETNAQKDGTIKRETCFPESAGEWILSGPHFFVGSPYYKTPRASCTKNSDYDNLQLTSIRDDYLPRTNYVPACTPEEYRKRTPRVPWDKLRFVTDYYRIIFRGMLSQSGERTLVGALIPKGAGHIHGAQSTAFKKPSELLMTLFFSQSLIADFYIKTTGRSNLHYTWLNFPIIAMSNEKIVRTLALNFVTNQYAELWSEYWNDIFKEDIWTKDDPRLSNDFFTNLTKEWHRDCVLRTKYARRQALVEIDVLAAMALGLTLDELKTIYRVQFPVLQAYEADTWYDQNGCIVFTNNRGFTGVGFSRPEWNEIKGKTSGTVQRIITDDTLPGGPIERTITYYAPFDRCNREKDYETAWKEFEKRLRG